MSEGRVSCTIEDGIASVVYDRPAARNAMTWAMYEQLAQICRQLSQDQSLRVAVFRGAGGAAFVAGTDIIQFRAFTSAQDALDYEEAVASTLNLLAEIPVPTLAAVEGAAVGGGLLLAAMCDLRITTPNGRFGVPIARTLGNCVTIRNLARLVAAFGMARTQRMLLLAEIIDAEEAKAAGFVSEIVPPEHIEERIAALCASLVSNAPITMRATKQGLRRLGQANLPKDHDLIAACYGSADFKEGVQAFVAKRRPIWSGH
jgi:enoyl-CoA hydratase